MYFTEGEVQEMRTRLPLVTISVVDSLVSYSASSALSANQGRVLGERVSFLEGRISALLHIETVHPWTGDSGIYSMVSAPDDTLNNVTNARVAYELKKRTDDLASRVTAIEAAIQSMSGGGGGGGTYILPVASDVTLGGVKIGSDSGLSIDAYGNLSVTGGGGGGTGGGWIGTTAVQANQTSGQNLTGIGSATLSGNLSVAGTSTLTGNVFVAGTKIYFGSSTAAPYLEYNSNGFHFSHGVYSDSFVSAGGIGSGGGGGGTGDNTWRPVYVGGTTQQYKVLDTNTENPLVFTGNGVVWDSSSNSIKIDATPVLWNQIQGSTGATEIATIKIGSGSPISVYAPSGSEGGSSTLAGLTDVNVSGVQSYSTLVYNGLTRLWSWTPLSLSNLMDVDFSSVPPSDDYVLTYSDGSWIAAPSSGGGGGGTNTWRSIYVNGSQWKGTGTGTGQVNFKAGTNVTLSTSGNSLTISASGSGGSGTDTWRPIYVGTTYASVTQKLGSGTNTGELTVYGNIVSWDSTNGAVKVELPAASSSILGGIKVGSGLSISNGVLSATGSGGGGSSVSWAPVSNIPSSWIPIGTLTIDGTPNTINAPGGGGISSFECTPSLQSGIDVATISWMENGTTNTRTIKAPTSQGVSVGSLNTNNSSALSVNSSESFSNTINLHKISKTGSYADLLNKPTLPSSYVEALNDLSDVTVSSMSSSDDRKHLIYDSGTQQWIADRIDFVKSTTFPASWVKIGELDGTELSVPLASENQVGIVGNGLLTPQRFSGKKVFAWDVAIGKVTHLYSEGPAIGTYAKFYIGEEADGYYMTYNSTDKCLHLYCGTGVSGSGTKLKIHGNVDIDGDFAVTGDIVANGSVTAGA